MLSDGEFNPDVATELKKRNGPKRWVVVNTIAFERNSKILHRIAEENGGEYRFIE